MGYAILFFTGDEGDEGTYVKWVVRYGRNGHKHFDMKPVHTFAEATKYETADKAKYAIKRTPDFNPGGSDMGLSAIVVDAEGNPA